MKTIITRKFGGGLLPKQKQRKEERLFKCCSFLNSERRYLLEKLGGLNG